MANLDDMSKCPFLSLPRTLRSTPPPIETLPILPIFRREWRVGEEQEDWASVEGQEEEEEDSEEEG